MKPRFQLGYPKTTSVHEKCLRGPKIETSSTRPAIEFDPIANKLVGWHLSERRIFVHVADDLAAEKPEVVDVPLDSLFRQA